MIIRKQNNQKSNNGKFNKRPEFETTSEQGAHLCGVRPLVRHAGHRKGETGHRDPDPILRGLQRQPAHLAAMEGAPGVRATRRRDPDEMGNGEDRRRNLWHLQSGSQGKPDVAAFVDAILQKVQASHGKHSQRPGRSHPAERHPRAHRNPTRTIKIKALWKSATTTRRRCRR